MPDMTHPKGVTAEVTQADREAAVDIHNVILHDWFTQHMLDGMEDECYVIQAFARHRLSSTAALEAEVERLTALLAERNARTDRLLNMRDKFIVDRGLWQDFVDALPSRPLQEQEKQNG